MDYEIKLTFITPMFSHGATDAPEIRAASIRGMLHHWFRLLGGTIRQEREVFGGIKYGKKFEETNASAIVVRVDNVNGQQCTVSTLPHKQQYSTVRNALQIGTMCKVRITTRMGSAISAENSALFENALKAWLLMGTLGFRSTRAAGSFVWECDKFPYPSTEGDYAEECRKLAHANFKSVLLSKEYDNAEKARKVVSDSLGGRDYKNQADDLAKLHDPLGKIIGGRKTSPLKYRIVKIADKFRILAVWDNRSEVTGNNTSDLEEVIKLLRDKKPEIGNQLFQANFV